LSLIWLIYQVTSEISIVPLLGGWEIQIATNSVFSLETHQRPNNCPPERSLQWINSSITGLNVWPKGPTPGYPYTVGPSLSSHPLLLEVGLPVKGEVSLHLTLSLVMAV